MFSLTSDVVKSITYHGKRYKLTPSFDRVLTVLEIQDDAELCEADKIDLSLSLLIRGRYPVDAELLAEIFNALSVSKPHGDNTKSIDMRQDAAYIYAAFRQAYGIDLIAERGRLHWQRFISLMMSLPSDTRIMDIAGIRTRKLPKATKYNAEERAELMRLKSIYGIELSEKEKDERLQYSLRGMVTAMRGLAENAKN